MRDPDGLLARAGTRGDPDRDQHFLIDDRVLDRLPGYLDGLTEGTAPLPSEEALHLLEIGAGTGALTDRLLDRAAHVTAIELDPELVAFLREEFADAIAEDRLDVIEGDALAVPLPEFDAAVANLPYGASSEILFELLPAGNPFVVTVQREFADRLVAGPGTSEYGRLSVSAGHYADVELVEPVPPEAFSPPPAVDSAVVRASPRRPDYEVPDDAFFLRFVKALFTQRRKTTRNAIRNTAHISGLDDPSAVVEAAADDDLDARPGELSPDEFAALATLAADVGVST